MLSHDFVLIAWHPPPLPIETSHGKHKKNFWASDLITTKYPHHHILPPHLKIETFYAELKQILDLRFDHLK